MATTYVNLLRCQQCDVIYIGNEVYAAHIQGTQHQRTTLEYTKQGIPIPPQEPDIIVGAIVRFDSRLRCRLCHETFARNDDYVRHIRGRKHHKVTLMYIKMDMPIPPQVPKIIVGMRESGEQPENLTMLAPALDPIIYSRAVNFLRCQLCHTTCNAKKDYHAHIQSFKHEKMRLLYTWLGMPIPTEDPEVTVAWRRAREYQKIKKKNVKLVQSESLTQTDTSMATANVGEPDSYCVTGVQEVAVAQEAAPDSKEEDVSDGIPDPDIQSPGQDYIEEIKNGKVIMFNCKLCECHFKVPDAKKMHMTSRRHELQYKKKVNPDLIVDEDYLWVDVKSSLSDNNFREDKSGGLEASPSESDSNGEATLNEDDTDEDRISRPDIQASNQDCIEDIKNDEGKVIGFNCKLCEFYFDVPDAKKMHMKGRKHRRQYKKKVNPDLVVDGKTEEELQSSCSVL
ncbi:zinc finger RNA-binding protein-like [Sitophilus oryzae]|uniref:Zinc finger RNA-binding protein-like n=1 Tax=Sitophilus oryzae TaxID=7048 RepID=A0A6J2XMC8_SITOR|nr:zinc finger RNA-binding protein-like [Sitophilus oryzae]